MNRHDRFVNCLLLNSTVRRVGFKELWRLKWHREWTQDAAETDAPIQPAWMQRFKDY